jgi:glycosyltransferase involved in cell wall biosynthesis
MMIDAMKRVYFFIGTLSKGGAERTVSTISQHISPDIDIKILLFGTDTRIDYPVRGDLLYLDETRINTPFNKLLTIFRRAKRIRQLKQKDPDAVFISFLEYPNLLNVLSSQSARTVLSVRNHISIKHRKGLKALFWKTLIRLTYHQASQVLAVSNDIRMDLIKHFNISPQKVSVLYNAYDLSYLTAQAEIELEPKYRTIFENPTLITMGRMNAQKGQWHLIRAFSKIKTQVPSAQLVILGEGQMMPALKALAEESGNAAAIHFLGFQKNPHHLIARSKAFVLPSHHEGFPNALAEAMACGVPVIASDCHSGPREILAPSEADQAEIDYGIQSGRFGLLYPVDYSRNLSAQIPLTASEARLAELAVSLLINADDHRLFAGLSRQRISDFGLASVIGEWESIIGGDLSR